MKRVTFGLIAITALFAACNQQKEEINIEQRDVYEIVLNAESSGDTFMDVELSAVFKNNEESIRVPGFYDGEGIYLQYTDGTPFYSAGTTAYQWTSVKQTIQAKTLIIELSSCRKWELKPM